MSFIPGRAKRLIAVRNQDAFKKIGDIELGLKNGDLLFFRPSLDDLTVPYKGMRQVSLFARCTVRSNLRGAWESAWQMLQGRAQSVPAGWDIDHVFPVCWARAKGFEYVLLTPVPHPSNRSAGAGVEKTAARMGNEQLLARYVDVDVAGNYAYLNPVSIAKLLGVAPGPAAARYPGLEKIKRDLKALQALLGY
jgi:hypothetical protein